jgi:hypothetical protein
MPAKVYALIFCLVVITTGCSSNDSGNTNTANAPASASPGTAANPATSPANPNTPTVKAKIDACSLLTSDDLKEVQGEAVKAAQRSDRQDGGFIVSQCYYSLPTSSNSVVLNVTTATEGAGAADPRTFWKDTFTRMEEKGKDRDREAKDKEKKDKEKKGEENEESVPPQKIAGLGEDAYWLASRVGGALYVLKKDIFFRISVGGAGDAQSKLKKSKTLAQRALKRI